MCKGLMTWLCVCVAAMAIGGCNNKPKAATDAGVQDADELASEPRPTITDVPMPAGFELDTGKSRSIVGGNTRLVDHVYKGNGDQGAIVRFFKKQMPAQRWSLTSSQQLPSSKGELIMNFVKDNERCTITIRGRNSLLHNTEIAILIYADAKIEPAGSGTRR